MATDHCLVSRVSQLTVEELEKMQTVAEAFARDAPACREFSWPIALGNWIKFYELGIATIFVLGDGDRVVGALGKYNLHLLLWVI